MEKLITGLKGVILKIGWMGGRGRFHLDSLLCLVKKGFNIEAVCSLAFVLELQFFDNSSESCHCRSKSL